MTTPTTPNLADMHVHEGVSAADSETAKRLLQCGGTALRVYASMGSADRDRVPAAALVERLGRLGETEDEVRAAFVELHALGLLEFVGDARVIRIGTWDSSVSRVLGGQRGSAVWPSWAVPERFPFEGASQRSE